MAPFTWPAAGAAVKFPVMRLLETFSARYGFKINGVHRAWRGARAIFGNHVPANASFHRLRQCHSAGMPEFAGRCASLASLYLVRETDTSERSVRLLAAVIPSGAFPGFHFLRSPSR